jgi:hypothetical protein
LIVFQVWFPHFPLRFVAIPQESRIVRCERIVRDLNLLFYAITLLPYVKRFNRFYQLFHIDHFFPQVLEVFRLVRGVAPARSARNGILKDIATILLENKTVFNATLFTLQKRNILQ